jgi:hypothetical protein
MYSNQHRDVLVIFHRGEAMGRNYKKGRVRQPGLTIHFGSIRHDLQRAHLRRLFDGKQGELEAELKELIVEAAEAGWWDNPTAVCNRAGLNVESLIGGPGTILHTVPDDLANQLWQAFLEGCLERNLVNLPGQREHERAKRAKQ